MNEDNPVLPDDVVLALVQRHVPTARRVTFVDESGRKGRAYFVDDEIVLKTHRPQRLRARIVEEFETSLEKEAFFLQQMNTDPRIPVAKLLGHGKEPGVEYVCMSRVPGVALRRAELAPSTRAVALRDLGRTLRRIHSLPQEPIVESGLFPNDGSPEQLKAKLGTLISTIVAAIGGLPEDWRPGVSAERAGASLLDVLPATTERATLHSNPAREHVYVSPQTGELLGLIDFGDAYIGHPAFDLRPWRDPEERATLMAGYVEKGPVDESFMTMWRIGLVLGELAGLLRRREPPARADANLKSLLQELGA